MASLKYVGNADLMTVTLASTYTASSGTMTLSSGDGAKLPTTGDFWIRPTTGAYQSFKVTARSTDEISVTGGQDGTTEASLPAGQELEWILGSSGLSQLKNDVVQNITLGVPSANPEGTGLGQLIVDYESYNLIPTMTNYNAPSGVASASSEYVATPAWYAFANSGDGWITNGTSTGWLQYQFGSNVKITSYKLHTWDVDTFPSRSPLTFGLLGSTNGTNFTTLDTRTLNTNQWKDSVNQEFNVSTQGSYTYYRLNITSNGGNAYTGCRRLELYGIGTSTQLGLYLRDSNGTIKTVKMFK